MERNKHFECLSCNKVLPNVKKLKECSCGGKVVLLPNKKRLNLYLDVADWKRIEKIAKLEKVSAAEIIRGYIREKDVNWIDRRGKPKLKNLIKIPK